ncbi:hypothetical protein TQ38_002390 [Novosphingobium sp. P6W]|nr:hypothetical protein TQ38_002390 [Novosphingobium sp. P6W]
MRLLQMSPATIDCALQSAKGNSQKVRRRGMGGSELRHSAPICAFNDCDYPAPQLDRAPCW